MNFRIILQCCALLLPLFLAACGTSAVEPNIPSPTEQSAGTASGTPASAVNPGSYLLSQGDKIGIQVFDEPDLTMEATVSASGIINYSYLGDITVSGKTALQLEKDITDLLRNGYLVNPSVNVSIVQFRPFFIGGEVRSPGSYPFQPGLTLDKAIALAGGLTDRASTRRMFVVKAGNPSDQQEKISLGSTVGPGDIISIREGFF